MAKQPEQDTVDTRPYEVSFSEIFYVLWRKRGIVLIALLIGAIVGIAAASNSISRISAPVTYYIGLTGMETVRNGRDVGSEGSASQFTLTYPNGTIFQPMDLLDRQVLDRVKTDLGLGKEVRLDRGITVSFDSPMTEGVMRRYRDRLAARSITQADVEILNQDFARDLLAANMSGLRIDVSPAAIGATKAVAIAVAKALPQAWRAVYTDRYRTLLSTDLEIVSVPQDGDGGDLSSASGAVAAQMALISMIRGTEIIADDNRLAGVLNSDGLSASDLGSRLKLFRAVRFAPFAAALNSDDASAIAYRRDIEARLAASKRRAETIDRTLQDMLRNPLGESPMQSNVGQSASTDTSGMLAQVLNLAERASLTPLLPSMLERREKASAEIGRLEGELAMISAQGAITPAVPGDGAAVAGELKQLTEQYQGLYASATERARAMSGNFYVDLSTPSSAVQRFSIRTLSLLITPMMIALVVALGYIVIASLVTRAVGRR